PLGRAARAPEPRPGWGGRRRAPAPRRPPRPRRGGGRPPHPPPPPLPLARRPRLDLGLAQLFGVDGSRRRRRRQGGARFRRGISRLGTHLPFISRGSRYETRRARRPLVNE